MTSAENILTNIGAFNTTNLIKEDTLMMADQAKVVGGANVESGALLSEGDLLFEGAVKTGGDFVAGSKVGDNSSLIQTVMDANTQSILDQALTTVALNANNMMALAAGRDPDKDLADRANQILAEAKASQIGAWIKTPQGKILAAVFVAGAGWFIIKKKGKR